jgi:ABC-type antimicrobial peptide transport system permease subunit
MKFRHVAKLSTRMFKARTSRTLLTILGMGVGIGAILFLVSMGYGIQRALLETITTSDSLLSLDVYPGKTEDAITLDNIENIKQIEGVDIVSPAMDTNIQVKFNGVVSDSMAMIIDSDFMRLNGTKIQSGLEINDNDPNGMLISPTFAKLFEKEASEMLGQEISISLKNYGKEDSQKTGKSVNFTSSYKIIGILDSKDNTAYLNAKSFESVPDAKSYSKLKVKCRDSQSVEAVRGKISESGFIVSALSDIVRQADKVFAIVRIILGFFGMIALLVSAIGMFNTMTVALLERTEEIGIMKSIGAYDSDILAMFVFESTVMGFLGGICGVILGVAGAKLFNFVINLIATNFGGSAVSLFYFPLWFLGFILFSATVVGFFTGIVPAKRASSVDPLDALRYK